MLSATYSVTACRARRAAASPLVPPERHPLAHWRERVAVRQARLVDAHPLFQLADEKVVLIDLAHVAHVRHAVNVHLVVAGLAVGGDLAARSGRRHW
jgi:hypothetical protein